MKTRRTRIAYTIADKTLKSGSTRSLSEQIAAYLLAERRVGDLDSILRDVQADWAKSGTVEVIASSAHQLSSATEAQITAQVTKLYPAANKIIVTHVEDPELIGGVRLNLPNQQLDLSVEAKLNKFKQLTTTGKE